MRDAASLGSALARPRQHLAHAKSPDPIDLAAVYTERTVRNHPFADGNTRTGVMVGVLFLELKWVRLYR